MNKKILIGWSIFFLCLLPVSPAFADDKASHFSVSPRLR
jgi:hypothetical protein